MEYCLKTQKTGQFIGDFLRVFKRIHFAENTNQRFSAWKACNDPAAVVKIYFYAVQIADAADRVAEFWQLFILEQQFTDRHIVEQRPKEEELKAWIALSGLPIKKFFNTSGMLYKEMNLKEKLPQMSQEEQIRLLASNGMLVKRPLLISDDSVLVGFRPDTWETQCK